MRLSLMTVTALLLALTACGPSNPIADHAAGNDGARTSAPMPVKPIKPVEPPHLLPPGVTREVLPDGSVRITIREPRCPSCQPWVF
jgi:hypothetical protein